MKHQTAAILVIGNEVLSGRTRDANAWLAAQRLFAQGCRLEEIAVVPDRMAAIIDTLNRLRGRYEAVITSGGIGPTPWSRMRRSCASWPSASPLMGSANRAGAWP
jgi:molybdopterin-biosynthesis enzyme MoeA-like protein